MDVATWCDESIECDSTRGPTAPNQVLKWNGSSLSWEADQAGGGSSSVDSDQIVDLSIDTGDIANGAITTSKINDDAVTADKIINGVITNGHIPASPSIDQSKINGLTTSLSTPRHQLKTQKNHHFKKAKQLYRLKYMPSTFYALISLKYL